jgi:hypothetical protein
VVPPRWTQNLPQEDAGGHPEGNASAIPQHNLPSSNVPAGHQKDGRSPSLSQQSCPQSLGKLLLQNHTHTSYAKSQRIFLESPDTWEIGLPQSARREREEYTRKRDRVPGSHDLESFPPWSCWCVAVRVLERDARSSRRLIVMAFGKMERSRMCIVTVTQYAYFLPPYSCALGRY